MQRRRLISIRFLFELSHIQKQIDEFEEFRNQFPEEKELSGAPNLSDTDKKRNFIKIYFELSKTPKKYNVRVVRTMCKIFEAEYEGDINEAIALKYINTALHKSKSKFK